MTKSFNSAQEEAAHWKARINELRKELDQLEKSGATAGALKFKRLHIRSLVNAVKTLTGEDY